MQLKLGATLNQPVVLCLRVQSLGLRGCVGLESPKRLIVQEPLMKGILR